MTLSAVHSRTVFRACVVTAVREGEGLMEQLVSYTLDELSRQASEIRVIAKRDLAVEALSLLRQHRNDLVKGYPMALLEVFADGPQRGMAKPLPSGIDFGELSLVDDDEVQAQVELSRAQQVALHHTEDALSELNGLVSAAQGLSRVQPERNPLRPENYIRALQRVVSETQVVAPVREAWMAHLCSFLGQQLVGVYERASKGLSQHGIEQVGWRSQSGSHLGYARSGFIVGAPGTQSTHGGFSGDEQYPSHSSYSGGGNAGSRTGAASRWQGSAGQGPMSEQVEEALLTVGILRQMLAGGGDPYQQMLEPGSQTVQVAGGVRSAERMRGGAPGNGANGGTSSYEDVAGAEVVEDMVQLERLVGRLASSQSGFQHSAQGSARGDQRSVYGAAESAPMGAEVVARMVENISRDSRLLPPIQKAVQDLEPAIRKLIRHDARFFSDANHPARRLLDEFTQRSLAFTHVEAPGFSGFMRLIDQAVAHLSKADITSAVPFETVRRALLAAWDAQQKNRDARQEREKRALMLAEAREIRAERVAQELASLDLLSGAPQDIADFVLGPWVEVVAAYEPADGGELSDDAQKALALAPLLLWSVQPELTRYDSEGLDEAYLKLPERLRAELVRAGQSGIDIDALLQRIAQLHRDALAAATPDIVLPVTVSAKLESLVGDVEGAVDACEESAASVYDRVAPGVPEPEYEDRVLRAIEGPNTDEAPASAETIQPAQEADEWFRIGTWVELRSAGKWMRTQLTWFSPHNTLFLFTGPDGSTQSMTRRMRDKLLAQDALRRLDTRPVVARAIDDLAKTARVQGSTGV